MKKKKTQKTAVSKKLLYFDYIIAVVLIIGFFACTAINGLYAMHITNEMICSGMDVSMLVINPPFNLDMYGVLLGIWVAQLGVSSTAYYVMCKSEHRIEIPMRLIEQLPKDIKEQVDMTTIITTALSCSDN